MGEGDLFVQKINHYLHFDSFHRYSTHASETEKPKIRSWFGDMIDAPFQQRKSFFLFVFSSSFILSSQARKRNRRAIKIFDLINEFCRRRWLDDCKMEITTMIYFSKIFFLFLEEMRGKFINLN